jgi:tetratricopeptide (TPR) repeat protein
MTAHNEYIELLCDVGALGGVIVAVGATVWAWRVLPPAGFRGRPERFLHAGALAGLVGLLLHSTINASLQVPANALMATILSAVLLGLSSARGARTSPLGTSSARSTSRWAAGVVAGAILSLVMWDGMSKVVASTGRLRAASAQVRADLETAHKRIRAALRWMPSDPEAQLELARIIRRSIAFGIPLSDHAGLDPLARLGTGVAAVAGSVDLNPVHAAAWMELGEVYQGHRDERNKREAMFAVGGEQGAEEKKRDPGLEPEDLVSLAAAARAIRLEPGGFAHHDRLARLYWERGLIDEASSSIRESFALMPAIAVHPSLLDPGLEVGLAGSILAGIEEAIPNRILTKAIKVRARAEVLVRMGRTGEAIEAYEALLRVAGSVATAECSLRIGKLEQARGRQRESIAILRRAVESGEDSAWVADAHYFIGKAHATLGEHEAALPWFRRYHALRPDRVLSHLALAKGLDRTEGSEAAEEILTRALERFPDDQRLTEMLADLH